MPIVATKHARIDYSTRGAGSQHLLLLCGLGSHAREWGERFLGALAQRFVVTCMDNRGIGRSQTDVANWSLDDMADDALAVLDALGLARAHVVGSSMGGMIAQCLALAQPERVARLVLMSTSFGGPEVIAPEPRAAQTLTPRPELSVGELRRRSLHGIMAEQFVAEHPEVVERLVQLREQEPTPREIWEAQFHALLQSDRSQAVRAITLPTLVVHGALDPLIPPLNAEHLAQRIPGARLLLLPGCGHMPHHEAPLETAQALIEFLTAAQ